MAKSINKLKDQARLHEQKEEWEKAAQLYQQVLLAADEDGSIAAELGLYNRIGDIYLRLGRARDAVSFYEEAADHYAADNLFNNAIALCHKALRHTPDRLELYRKLGRLSASQGFFTDARRWYVEFAERSIRKGALDEAFAALGELADATDDPEPRELLARQLFAHGRAPQAVDEMRRAWASHMRAGDHVGADALREELRAIDAEAADSLDESVDAAPAADDPLAGLPLLEDPDAEPEITAGAATLQQTPTVAADAGAPHIVVDAPPPPEGSDAPSPPEGFETDLLAGDSAGVAEIELSPLKTPHDPAAGDLQILPLLDLQSASESGTGEKPLQSSQPLPPLLNLEGTGFSAGADHTPLPPLLDLEGVDFSAGDDDADPLPLLDLDEPDSSSADDWELTPLTFLEDDANEDGSGAPDSPTTLEPWQSPEALDSWAPDPEPEPWAGLAEPEVGPQATPPQPNPEPELPAEIAADAPAAPDVDEVVMLARSLYGHGQPAAGRAALEQLLSEVERADDAACVLQALDALAELEPDDVDVQQRRVEQTFTVRGPREAVAPLVELAAALERGGLAPRASVVYQQILDIDPSNDLAGAALRKEREARPKPEDAPGEFIDLGALLLEPEEEASTRFVVSQATPSGDEERDFVEMLEQFKEKVAEHMGEDPQAHYDLGLAYKEMGLLDEAVAEFQIGLRNGQDRLKVLEELGRCFLLKEEPRIALRLLGQALAVTGRSEVEYMGVNYLLGRCYEDVGEYDAARGAYERVAGLDIQFDDVAERLARL